MISTKKELFNFIDEQKEIFEVVRIVDAGRRTEYQISESGELIPQPYMCYAIWSKTHRCDNCIAAKVIATQKKKTKFEFVENDVYMVVAVYLELEGEPYVLEMISKVNDDTLFGAYGKGKFVKTITKYNQKIYIDALTGAYNRRYYDEQLEQLDSINTLVMLDADHFKNINDTYGHGTGDIILKKIVETIGSVLRDTDSLVRLGGDEFLILFHRMKREALEHKLEEIRTAVNEIKLPEFPELNVSISQGCVYADFAAKHLDDADKALYEAKKTRNCYVIKDLS